LKEIIIKSHEKTNIFPKKSRKLKFFVQRKNSNPKYCNTWGIFQKKKFKNQKKLNKNQAACLA